MSEITVHRTYCEEHSARDHYLDENNKCHGETLKAIEARGYTWARNIGSGWYRLHERSLRQQDLAWEMAADAHTQTRDNQALLNDVEF